MNASGASAAILGFGVISPNAAFSNMMTVLALSTTIGYQVVWGVAPALHSPLMAATNAISGVTALGGMHLMGGGLLPCSLAHSLGAVATGAFYARSPPSRFGTARAQCRISPCLRGCACVNLLKPHNNLTRTARSRARARTHTHIPAHTRTPTTTLMHNTNNNAHYQQHRQRRLPLSQPCPLRHFAGKHCGRLSRHDEDARPLQAAH
jgi:hypothetical protein